jgi:hypothetical protein
MAKSGKRRKKRLINLEDRDGTGSEGHAWISRLGDQQATRREKGSDEQARRRAARDSLVKQGRSAATPPLAQPRRRRPCRPRPLQPHVRPATRDKAAGLHNCVR